MNLSNHLTSDFERLNLCIQNALHSEVALVQQVAAYIVQAGGKRMRPAMLMLAADVVDLRQAAHTTTLAAVVEFIHTATLLHDDVVDESEQRRGKATANALFGNAASVLVGDFLYSRAFQMMVQCGKPRIMEVLADATNVIAEGEVLQLMHIGNTALREAQYLQVIEYKTAKLFEAAARLPAVLAGDQHVETVLARYGRKVGAAFQIIDDVLDYEGDASLLGKNLGDDLREGKMTLPLIYALQTGNAQQISLIEHTISNAGLSVIAPQVLIDVVNVVQTLGAAQKARQTAQDLVTEALSALNELPNTSAGLTPLRMLAEQAIMRVV